MKLTIRQVREIIKEELNTLLEIGDSAPYEFKEGKWDSKNFTYYFTTDEKKGALEYKVKFNIDIFAEPEAWEIDFNLTDKKQYSLTGQRDSRIMPTIVGIIRDFAKNPNHETKELHKGKEKIYFTFFGIKKQNEKDTPSGVDTIRTRYYKRLLRNAGIEVTEDEDNNITFVINRNM